MKTVKIIIKVIYNTLFVLLILASIFIILTSYNIIKGYNFYVVMSGSMEPSIHTGSVVGVKEQEKYEIEDVITIKMKNDTSQTYTHRIIDIDEEQQYQTKGDANESKDPDLIAKDYIVGKVIINIPIIGYIANFAKQPAGFILMIILPCVIIVANEMNKIKDMLKEKIKEKNKLKENKDD